MATHPMLHQFQMNELERKYAKINFDYAKPAATGWMAEQHAGEQKGFSEVITTRAKDTTAVKTQYSFRLLALATIERILRMKVLPRQITQRTT